MEVLVVLIIALAVLGPKRLPELGSSLGRGIREFRASLSGEEAEEGGVKAKRLDRPSIAAGQPEREVVSDKRA
jgi:sec-independent protein translocase protein TatA